jgi:hypothetical protein
VSVLRKLGKTRMDGSSLQGAGASGTASLPFFFGRNKTVLSAATQDVVEIALYASLFQHTTVKLVEWIDCVGKNMTAVACEHPRLWWDSICRRVGRSRGFRQELKSKGDERGRSPHIIHDEKSIFI